MSVTADDIPHGLQGYRKYKCRCDVCRTANTAYCKERSDIRKGIKGKVVKSDKWGRERSPKVQAAQAKRRAGETNVSGVGPMEQAVIDETADNPVAQERPTVVMAARTMARILDNPKQVALHPTTNRQFMSLMEILQPKASAGKRKSGGRLATVQKLQKSNRRVAQ